MMRHYLQYTSKMSILSRFNYVIGIPSGLDNVMHTLVPQWRLKEDDIVKDCIIYDVSQFRTRLRIAITYGQDSFGNVDIPRARLTRLVRRYELFANQGISTQDIINDLLNCSIDL